MILMTDWRMCMDMNGGAKNDMWRLSGNTGGALPVMPSYPISLEVRHDGHLLETFSGSRYLLRNCAEPARSAEWIKEIQEAVTRKGWERH